MGNVSNIARWREHTFSSLMSVVLAVGAISTVAIIPFLLQNRMWHVVVADLLALGWMLGIWRLNRLSYIARVYNFLAVVYALAIVLMLSVGSASLSYLLGPPLIAAILLNLRSALVATVLGVLAMIVIGASGRIELSVPGWGHAPLKSSLVAAINYSTVALMLSLMSSTLLQGLARSLSELELTSAAVSRLSDMVLIFSTARENAAERTIIFVNDAFLTRTGHTREQVLGQNLRILQGPDTDAGLMSQLLQAMEDSHSFKTEMLGYSAAGASFWLEIEVMPFTRSGEQVDHSVVVSRDINERKAAAYAIHRSAFYDVLTGLPNRRFLIDRLSAITAKTQPNSAYGVVLYLDIDNFKDINDERGHAIGDLLLGTAGSRVEKALNGEGIVARIGGDEFVILLEPKDTDRDAAVSLALSIATHVRAALAQPLQLEGQHYRISVSIGIALAVPGADSHDILREADTAMYHAKAAGRDGVMLFDRVMLADAQRKLTLARELGVALDGGHLSTHLQLQVDRSGAAVGAELLMRWRRADGSAVTPDVFIPVAETSGLIVPLGHWVLLRACEAWLALELAGAPMTLSINVSPLQFRQIDFVDQVRAVLRATGAPARQLVFEVTEGLLIEEIDQTIARMHELAALGIRFSVDDFGTGYSNLAYLRKMPLYELKIDKSFMRETPSDKNSAAIVHAILSMAKHLGLQVVAEGVESAEQASFLGQHGNVIMQGYYFHRPAPLEDVLKLCAAPKKFFVADKSSQD